MCPLCPQITPTHKSHALHFVRASSLWNAHCLPWLTGSSVAAVLPFQMRHLSDLVKSPNLYCELQYADGIHSKCFPMPKWWFKPVVIFVFWLGLWLPVWLPHVQSLSCVGKGFAPTSMLFSHPLLTSQIQPSFLHFEYDPTFVSFMWSGTTLLADPSESEIHKPARIETRPSGSWNEESGRR